MKAVALCLLAVRSASFDLTTKDVGELLDGVHYHHSTLRSFVKEYVPLPLDVMIPPQSAKPLSNESCCECREYGAKRVMEHAVYEIIEMCRRAEDHHCGRAARVCMMMRLHKEVTLGMVIEHVRPFALSGAYCVGKGACHHHHENSTLSDIVSGNEVHDLVLKHFDKIDWNEVLERAREPEEEEAEQHEKDGQDVKAEREMQVCEARQKNATDAKQHNFCPYCFKRVMGLVMCKATMAVKMMCMKTHDPHTMRMCEFAYQHREVAFGMLLAKVEPWKFAMGACSHRRGHHHGDKHHGHHHGGKHHGHHHGGKHHPKRWHMAKKFVNDVAHKISDMITI